MDVVVAALWGGSIPGAGGGGRDVAPPCGAYGAGPASTRVLGTEVLLAVGAAAPLHLGLAAAILQRCWECNAWLVSTASALKMAGRARGNLVADMLTLRIAHSPSALSALSQHCFGIHSAPSFLSVAVVWRRRSASSMPAS